MQAVISERDHHQLEQLVVKQKHPEIKFLKDLLKRLRIIKEKDLSKKTIRLNSIVVFWNSFLKRIVKLRIVLPEREDLKNRQVSVLSPISLALIGRRERENLIVVSPGLEKKLRILRVIND